MSANSSGGVRQLNIHLEKGDESDFNDAEITDARKVGIADGGHTFAVISNTMDRVDDAIGDFPPPQNQELRLNEPIN